MNQKNFQNYEKSFVDAKIKEDVLNRVFKSNIKKLSSKKFKFRTNFIYKHKTFFEDNECKMQIHN